MKKTSFFQKKEATKQLVNECELQKAEQSRTHLLDEEILIDELFLYTVKLNHKKLIKL
ncbi:hypothetical protein [Spiroplasma endosymbiont of Polydrusus cervinus]|uniref:hypothetical protein n=1 Tax=Spiroplasma endosymbiont of Polydrusus cervinus TaxID=3066287 RepID=UPI0030D2F130